MERQHEEAVICRHRELLKGANMQLNGEHDWVASPRRANTSLQCAGVSLPENAVFSCMCRYTVLNEFSCLRRCCRHRSNWQTCREEMCVLGWPPKISSPYIFKLSVTLFSLVDGPAGYETEERRFCEAYPHSASPHSSFACVSVVSNLSDIHTCVC